MKRVIQQRVDDFGVDHSVGVEFYSLRGESGLVLCLNHGRGVDPVEQFESEGVCVTHVTVDGSNVDALFGSYDADNFYTDGVETVDCRFVEQGAPVGNVAALLGVVIIVIAVREQFVFEPEQVIDRITGIKTVGTRNQTAYI